MAEEGNVGHVGHGESSKPSGVRSREDNQAAPPGASRGILSTVHHPQPPARASSRHRSASRGRSRARRSHADSPNKGPLLHANDPHPLEGHQQGEANPSTSRPPRASPSHGNRAIPHFGNAKRPQRAVPHPQNEPHPQTRSWAAVAKSTTKGYLLSYIPPHRIDNRVVAEISDDILEDADPKWRDCLVGYFIGRKLPFKLVEEALKHIWGHQLHDLRANDDGFYFMHIPDSEFRRGILDGGCFTVARVPLILQQFTPLVDLQRARHHSVPIWIKLRNVPYSLWSPRGLSAIASGVGKPLYVDSRTEKMTLLSFARVCVEIEGGVTLPDHVDVHLLNETRTVKVEYEWKPSFCSQCATFGHKCPTPSPPLPEVDVSIRDNPPLPHTLVDEMEANEGWKKVDGRKSGSPIKQGNMREVDIPNQGKATVVGLVAQSVDARPDRNPSKAVMIATSSISEEEENSVQEVQEENVRDGTDDEVDSTAVDEFVVKSTIPEEAILSKSARKRAKKKGTPRDPQLDISSCSNTDVPKSRVASRSARSSKPHK